MIYKINKNFLIEVFDKVEEISTEYTKQLDSQNLFKNSSEDTSFENIISKKDYTQCLLFDIKKHQKSFIKQLDPFLESRSYSYSKEELMTLKDVVYKAFLTSYNSIYLVKEIVDRYSFVLTDLVLNKNIIVHYSNQLNLHKGDCFLGRIVNFPDNNYVFSKVNNFSHRLSEIFLKNLVQMIKSNHKYVRSKSEITAILKEQSLDILTVYIRSFREYVEYSDEINSLKHLETLVESFFDLEDVPLFRYFVLTLVNEKNNELERLFYSFQKIFINYIEPEGLNFSTVEMLNLEDVILQSVKDGIYFSNEEFAKTLYLMRNWLEFAIEFGNRGQQKSKSLKEVKNIFNNIFNYKQVLMESYEGIYVEEIFVELVKENSVRVRNSIISDFDLFLDYVQFESYRLTKEGKTYPSICKEFSKVINLEPTKNVKNLTQDHFPYIEILLKFFLTKRLGFADDSVLNVNDNTYSYSAMSYESKLALWIHTIFNRKFAEHNYGLAKSKELFKQIQIIFTTAQFEELTPIESLNIERDYNYLIELLGRLQILDIDVVNNSIKFTKLGRELKNYYYGEKDNLVVVDFKKTE